MLVFYLISLPLTMGMVILTLKYFAGPDVPTYVFFTVGYTWFCSFSIIILVPADIWTTIVDHSSGGISFFWSLSYWSTFLLTWAVVPTIQGYEDAGDFTMAERLKTSIHGNLVFYLCVGSIGLVGLILFIIFRKNWSGGILGFAMACSNTFGLVTGAFLLGFGLSEIPKGIWKNVDWTVSQKVLSHKVAKMAVKLDDAHQEFSNVIVVAQATSNQISKRDPLRPYMNIIDSMLHQMLKEDPSFKPQGGRFGENDMDYDTDEKSMATLRRRLRIAREEYCRYRRYTAMCEYMSFVLEALELEDTVKNYERRDATGWKFISSFRPERKGRLGASLDMLEFIWRCVLRKQLEKLLAIILGCMSAALLLAEATILPNGVDLSLFSILINSVGKQEMLVQVAAFIPLMYMCVCTYYSLFKIGMLMFYSFTPKQTSSVSLLMICSMVARYAPPISYNFLNLIHLPGNRKTIFEKRMGNIDDAVPFFGKGFNKIYPLIMVIYTLLLVTNFFDRVIDYFGNWKLFKFQDEADDTDGFDPSGLIILQKGDHYILPLVIVSSLFFKVVNISTSCLERSWLERGHKVGEHVIPLARNFNGMSIEIEPGSNNTDKAVTDTSVQSAIEIGKGDQLKPLKEEAQHDTSKEAISKKYFGIRAHQNIQASNKNSTQKDLTSLTVDAGNSESAMTPPKPSGGLASKWESMKSGLLNFKSNLEAKKFLPLQQTRENTMASGASSSESLDEIFQRLKRPTLDLRDHGAENDLFEHD
ncbi:LMBR1-like membrane protein - like 4 [Theobroma cacao]|nr:LMBR1-like membrane protein - like 3 [Theobroma cacao]WRX15901.1 LMBR1-like membrane protein - like 4 [Theobroma cacao]